MIFFCDENISHKLAQLLEVFDRKNEILAHKDSFEAGESDKTWMKKVGGWNPKPIILSGDGRILTNPAELAALKSVNLHFVYLKKGWTSLSWGDQAWKMIRVWPRITHRMEHTRNPTVFEVSVGSMKVEQVKLLADFKTR